MGNYKGKRFTVTVDLDLYARLVRIRKAHRFKSLSEFANVSLRLIAAHIERGTQTASDGGTDITDMFNEFSAWERTPDGNPPKRGHKKQDHGEK